MPSRHIVRLSLNYKMTLNQLSQYCQPRASARVKESNLRAPLPLLTDTRPCANVPRLATGIVTLAKKIPPPVDFEGALAELEALVEKMEQGDIRLEESLQHFERGVQLTRQCQRALQAAEQKVNILLENSHSTELKAFSDED